MAGGFKADDKRAIGLVFKDLRRMKQESPRMGSYIRFEPPNHFAIFSIVLKCPKSLLRVTVDVEANDERRPLARGGGIWDLTTNHTPRGIVARLTRREGS